MAPRVSLGAGLLDGREVLQRVGIERSMVLF